MNPKIFKLAKQFIESVPVDVAREVIENLLLVKELGKLFKVAIAWATTSMPIISTFS